LKRQGEKGEGKWQKISWDQALDEIADKVAGLKKKYGPECFSHSFGTSFRGEVPLKVRFFLLLGAPLNGAEQGTICFLPRAAVANAIVGMFPHYSLRPNTKCIVLLGAEPLISRPITARIMLDAMKNGAKLIVIDPRQTLSASRAHVWLQLRPGTDCALLLGMIYVMIEEQLYDKEFVSKWCYGFDKLRERIKDYPPDKVEKITDVPASRIIEAARLYAANRPGCMVEGMGIEELQNNAEILHARWILSALAGNIDVEGGEELTGPHPGVLTSREVSPKVQPAPNQMQKQLGGDKFRLLGWPGQALIMDNMRRTWGRTADTPAIAHGPMIYRAMITGKPYPVRAMFTTGSNPMVTTPNTKLVYRALKSLDLYVVKDYWLTPSAELADYVLPTSSWLERPLLRDFSGYDRWMIAGEAALPEAIPGEYDHRDDFDLWRGLGVRLGQAEFWPWKTLEEYYDAQLKPTGMSLKEFVHKVRAERKIVPFKKYEKAGFGTTTGKVELYSTVFEKLGYDPLPRYEEPSETPVSNPELAKEYPLTLITGGRFNPHYHSEWRQIESARRLRPYPLVQIHPETARTLGIEEGDWVWIETVRGRVGQKATLFGGLKPNVVHAEHGWWYPELPGEEPWLHGVWESNINVVLDDDPEICNSLTGAWPLRTALCKVYKVKTYSRPG
jgi:anaerobic selenocysteine-containing dehydrogenase